MPAGAGAADGVANPACACGDPDDVGCVVGNRGDQDVVAVGDHGHLGVCFHAGPQAPLDGVDFAHAVKLVAREVQQHQAGRIQAVGNRGDVQFVAFQHHVRRPATRHECGNDAGVHVVATFVGGHGVLRAQCCGQHACGGGFAVGAGDQGHGASATEVGHDVRVNGPRDEAADHATGPPTSHLRRLGGQCRRCGGHGSAQPLQRRRKVQAHSLNTSESSAYSAVPARTFWVSCINSVSDTKGMPLRRACMAFPRSSPSWLHTTRLVSRVSCSE